MATPTPKQKKWTWASILFVLLLVCTPISFDVMYEGFTLKANAQVGLAVPAAQYVANVAGDTIVEKATDALAGMGTWIGHTLLSTGSLVVWLGGMLFDASVDWFIVEFGSHVRTETFQNALNYSWATIRDICNLAFIFGFIYIGIRTIIDPDSSSTKRFLSRIIIGALLINFSLYITQVVIDFTNFSAVQIYNAIVPPDDTTTISVAIGNYLGISGIFSNVDPQKLAQLSLDGGVAFYFAAAVFLWVTGLTLAAGGLLLLVRFVELLLIMIFSPILFAAPVFPQTEQYASKIWHKLISSAFYAPIYMLLLYLSLAIAQGLTIPQTGDLAGTLSGVQKGSFEVVLNFCIIIFLMISALTLAKKMSVAGGQMAIHVTDTARKGAQGYLGRGTVRTVDAVSKGLGIGSLENAEKYRQRLRGSDKWTDRVAGRVFGATVGKVATKAVEAKFQSSQSVIDVDKEEKGYKQVAAEYKWEEDAKKAIDSGDSAALERTVVGASEKQTAALLKAYEKNETVYKQILANIPNARIEKLLDEKSEHLSDEKKELLAKRREEALDEKFVREENARRVAKAAKDGTTAIPVAKIDDDKRMVANALVTDLEARGFEFVKKYAGYLTAAQIEDMKKSKAFVEAEIKQIEAARTAYFTTMLDAANPTRNLEIVAEIKARKPKDIAKLPEELLTDASATPHMTIDMINAIVSDTSIDYSTQQKVVENLRTMLSAQTTPNPILVKYINSSRMIDRYP